jgi:hypothetical protein
MVVNTSHHQRFGWNFDQSLCKTSGHGLNTCRINSTVNQPITHAGRLGLAHSRYPQDVPLDVFDRQRLRIDQPDLLPRISEIAQNLAAEAAQSDYYQYSLSDGIYVQEPFGTV